jgi:acetylglutamate kinase
MNKAINPEIWQTGEGQFYLDEFKRLEPDQFAVIKIGGSLIEDEKQLNLIGNDIAGLYSLGLYPVIVHGAGPQIDQALEYNGFESSKKDGIRITKPEHMRHVAMAIWATNQWFSDEVGLAIDSLVPGAPGAAGLEYIFSATLEDEKDFGSVKEIINVDLDRVKECMDYKEIPVISSIGRLAVAGEAELMGVNINADIAAAALARALKPKKYISLTKIGSVLDTEGEPISRMSIGEAKYAIDEAAITGGMKVKVEQALHIIENGVHDFVITSPENLLKELFTSEGSGTLIYKD